MRNILFLLLIIIGCRGVPLQTVKEESVIIPSVISGTVALIEEGSEIPYCTGVWIGGEYIITAHHCVVVSLEDILKKLEKEEQEDLKIEDLIKLQYKKVHYITQSDVKDIFTKPEIYRDADIVGLDRENDLALLKVRGIVPMHDIIKISNKVSIGDKLHIVGHVQGLAWTYMQGVVSAERSKDSASLIQVSAPIYFGVSGGGAFNEYGELIGMASFIHKAPNIGFFISSKTIKKFLDENLVK
jgi:S1-C subfamily serine protease